MCYYVVEKYSICRCLYYKHSVDMCLAYGQKGHPIQERTVLVGYACERHSSSYQKEALLWSSGSEPTTSQIHPGNGPHSARQGVKITSTAALRALEDAQLREDDETSTEIWDESVMDTASTQSTVEDDLGHEPKAQGVSNHDSTLVDLRSRLRYPRQYIMSGQELEGKVWRNSAISMYTSNSDKPLLDLYKNLGIPAYIPYPLVPSELQDVIPNRLSDDSFTKDPTNTSDEEITAVCQSTTDRTTSSHLNSIRTCRNVILRTFLNLKLLQQSNFCAGSFSIIILDKRRQNVAILLPVEIRDFIALVYELEYILRDSASLVLNARGFGSKALPNIDSRFDFLKTAMVKQYCKSLLQIDPESSSILDLGVVNVLRALVFMLDLAVASYAGAHCSDFLSDVFSTNDAIALLEPFEDCSDDMKKSSVKFRHCKLQCLDTFHLGRWVGVFCPPKCEPSLPLYISATIDSFSDIWGPLWKLKDQNNPHKYSAYVVGSGSIVQWRHDSLTSPALIKERFCHWICNEELEDGSHDKLDQGTDLPYIPFDGAEQLLIGAPTNSTAAVSPEVWAVNPKCSVPISEVRTRLREAGRLCIVGASKPYHYNDSNQYQLQIGYSGVNASATRQYKRVPGQSLKEILIELWAMEPEIRDPKLLEDLHGVEISMCTSNAQRVSLAQVLRLKCMQNLLRDFNWRDPSYRTEHFLTLEDPLRPKRLLDAQFKERYDYAVMLGLKMLSKTGVDREDNLLVFLSSKCTPKPELATMVSKEHNWIGLLKDTTTECAMAAFGDACLEFKYHDGVLCGRAGHSAFRSAMIPHSSSFPSFRQLKVFDQSMNTSQSSMQELDMSTLEPGKVFHLGERGKLRLKANLHGNTLVVGWSSGMRMTFKSKLGREPVVHREHTEIDHSEESRVAQPVPIIVVSDRLRGLI